MKKKLTLLFISIILMFSANAQQISNANAVQEADNVIITYDILNAKQGQKFDISVTLSADGGKTFTIIPFSITGDIKQITAGTGKRIIWNVLADREETTGDNFVFMIKAKITGGTDYGIEMVFVKGGSFTMGCTSEQGSDCESDEKPAHSVTVSDFNISKYELTISQYMVFVNETKSHYPEWLEEGNSYNINGTGSNKDYYSSRGMSLSNTNYPITGVSWNDALAYCSWLSLKTGKTYRLPTEAEWEYAARGGTKSKGYKYSGSNTIDDIAWYSSNSGSKTHPVGGKQANELGIYDMSGNVWEWCSDWKKGYPGSSGVTDYTGSYRVNRGGSWSYYAASCRVASRNSSSPGYRSNGIGFRLVSPE